MTTRPYRFTVILLPERDAEFAGYYNAVVPALPVCVSYGTNKGEALSNIREAIEAYVEDMRRKERRRHAEWRAHSCCHPERSEGSGPSRGTRCFASAQHNLTE